MTRLIKYSRKFTLITKQTASLLLLKDLIINSLKKPRPFFCSETIGFIPIINCRLLFQDLPLSDILSIECNTDHSGKAGKGGAYVFSLKTNQVTYYCGEREEFDDTGCIIPAESDSGKGIRIGLAWAEMIKNALQPVCITPTATPTASVISTSTPPSG